MKKLIFSLLVCFFALIPALACADHFEWTHAGADGFIIYYADQNNSYNYNVVGDVRSCELSLLNLKPGVKYTFYATAYNESGESGPSNIITYTKKVFTPPANVLPVVQKVPDSPSELQNL